MAQASVPLMILPWTAKDKTSHSEKQLQSLRRHQHTALASHRRRRELQGLRSKGIGSKADFGSDTSSVSSPAQSSGWESEDSTLSRDITRSSTPWTSDIAPPPPISILDSNRLGPF